MGVGPIPTNSETSKKAIGRIFVGQNDLFFKIKPEVHSKIRYPPTFDLALHDKYKAKVS